MKNKLFLQIIFIIFFPSGIIVQAQSAIDITNSMFTSCKKIHTLNYTLKKVERIKGDLITQQSTIKLKNDPFKIYLRQEVPKQGVEVLYAEGNNNNNAHVNPNGFPWLSLNLSPLGSTMRAGQHHTIFHSGYAYFSGILENTLLKYQSDVQNMLKLDGSVVWDKQNCWVITLTNRSFKYLSYSVQKGETLLTIAAKFKLSEYMILEKNPLIKDYHDVKTGQVIKIPSDYSTKTILYVDKIRFIPLVMKIYDDQGLYEQYEYTGVNVNGIIPVEEFTKEYKDYHF
jgi:outer membrane lipoprotein-sorting protein